MSPDETKRILGYMLAAWPNHKLDELGALVWNEHLADIPADEGLQVARILVDNNPWFPSVSEFRGVWKRQNHAERRQFALPAPTEPQLSPAEVRARVDAMKAMLPKRDRPARPTVTVATINEDTDPGLRPAPPTPTPQEP